MGLTADTIKRWYVNQRYKTHNEVVQRKNLWITLRRKSEDVDITRVPFDVELSTFVARFNPDECCLVINQGSEAANIETSSNKKTETMIGWPIGRKLCRSRNRKLIEMMVYAHRVWGPGRQVNATKKIGTKRMECSCPIVARQ